MMSDEETKAKADDYPSALDWVYTDAGKRKLWWFLGSLCAASFGIELLYGVIHLDEMKPGDLFPGAFMILGFVSCTAMIYIAKWLGKFLKVKPDFYGKEENDSDE